MFLINSRLGRFTATTSRSKGQALSQKMALLLPKLRSHFAEFLNNASPVGLRILSSPTCVGLRYGYSTNNSGFSWQLAHTFPYFSSVCITSSDCHADLPARLLPRLPRDSIPASALPLRPHSSVILQYRNFNLLSIGYVFRPHLRPRLTQSRSALLWKPWIFGLEDSHLYLATHSGILSSMQSTAPYGTASSRMQCSSTNPLLDSLVSVVRFSPGHFRRRTSRPVSYYALFE